MHSDAGGSGAIETPPSKIQECYIPPYDSTQRACIRMRMAQTGNAPLVGDHNLLQETHDIIRSNLRTLKTLFGGAHNTSSPADSACHGPHWLIQTVSNCCDIPCSLFDRPSLHCRPQMVGAVHFELINPADCHKTPHNTPKPKHVHTRP